MCGKNSVTLVSEEEMSEAPEVKVRKFEITDDKVGQLISCVRVYLCVCVPCVGLE